MKNYFNKDNSKSIHLLIFLLPLVFAKHDFLNADYLFEELEINTSTTKEDSSSEIQTNEAISEQFNSFPNKKVRRNSPCPCGSGKKFKHCCGAI